MRQHPWPSPLPLSAQGTIRPLAGGMGVKGHYLVRVQSSITMVYSGTSAKCPSEI